MTASRPSVLRNLGPASDAMLAEIGIRTVAELRACGAVKAFMALKRLPTPKASRNLLWALEGALSDRHWRDVARDDRLRLLTELDARGVRL